MRVYVNGAIVDTDDPSQCREIACEGEATVWLLLTPALQGQVLKIWHTPDHAFFYGVPEVQQAVRDRLARLQHKMRSPLWARMPDGVVTPIHMATVGSGASERTVGFTMRYVANAMTLAQLLDESPLPQERTAAQHNSLLKAVRDRLYTIIAALHAMDVLAGDALSFKNIMVDDQGNLWVIDCETLVFPGEMGLNFNPYTVDPTQCDYDRDNDALLHTHPYTKASDWFAFTVVVWVLFSGVHPYAPEIEGFSLLSEVERAFKGLWFEHPGTKYPLARHAVQLEAFSPGFLRHIGRIFAHKARDDQGFPMELLKLEWRECAICHRILWRVDCPAGCVVPRQQMRGMAVPRRQEYDTASVFIIQGSRILDARFDGRMLCRLTLRPGTQQLEREFGVVAGANHQPGARYGVFRDETYILHRDVLQMFHPRSAAVSIAIQGTGHFRSVALAQSQALWICGDRVYRRTRTGGADSIQITSHSQGGMYLAAGETFAVLLRHLPTGWQAYIWSLGKTTLSLVRDFPSLPTNSKILGAHFADDRCWLLYESGAALDKQLCAMVISRDGKVLGSGWTRRGDDRWLTYAHKGFAIGDDLFVPGPDGIMRVVVNQYGLCVLAEIIRETYDYMTWNGKIGRLLPAQDGVYVVWADAILYVTVKPR